MLLSYAQNLEDYHLDLVFPDGPGTYVDVGGGHPVADNVSFWFYLRGWQGLVVEPQEPLAALYAGVRPRDRVMSCLAGRSDGEVDFYEVQGLHGLSSMVAANAEQARGFDKSVVTSRKRVRPLSALIDEAGFAAVDFLKIDVEGAEAEVMAGLDLARHRPLVIVVEALNPNNMKADVSGFEPTLVAAGYTPALSDGLNRFYVRGDRPDLLERLPAVHTPWDRVAHLWDCGRAGNEPKHPDRKLAEILAAGLFAELPLLGADQLARIARRGMEALYGAKLPDLRSTLAGSAEFPGAKTEATTLGDLLSSDDVRAALGRISCMYDGGHVVE